MIKSGMMPHDAVRTWVNMKKWSSTNLKEVCFVMNLAQFGKLGLVFLYDFTWPLSDKGLVVDRSVAYLAGMSRSFERGSLMGHFLTDW